MTPLPLALIGIALLIVGALMHRSRNRALERLDGMTIVTSFAADVPDLMVGGPVEVKGRVACPQPLTAPFSGKPCVWYSALTYERLAEWETDDKGARQRRERERLSGREEDVVTFDVEDRTGRVSVDARAAKIDGETVLDDIDSAPDTGGAEPDLSGDVERLGVRKRETILPIGAEIYVFGTLQSDKTIGPPVVSGETPFIVSMKSEEEIEGSLVSKVKWMKFGLPLMVAGGIALAVSLATAILG